MFVETESRQIGLLRLPNAMHEAIRLAACLRVEATRAAHVEFLLRDYHYLCDAARIDALLLRLKELQGAERVRRWQQLAHEGNFATLIDELLVEHYDPPPMRDRNADITRGSSTHRPIRSPICRRLPSNRSPHVSWSTAAQYPKSGYDHPSSAACRLMALIRQ